MKKIALFLLTLFLLTACSTPDSEPIPETTVESASSEDDDFFDNAMNELSEDDEEELDSETVVEQTYVGSVNSNIYHYPSCI